MGELVKLLCTKGPLKGEVLELDPVQVYIIGRDPNAEANSTIFILPSKTVSRNHCKIEYNGTDFVITDLGSFNGVRVNNTKTQEYAVRANDKIQLGEFTFMASAEEKAKPTETIPVEDSVVKPGESSKVWKDAKKDKASDNQNQLQAIKEKISNLDFRYKTLILLLVISIISHWVISASFISDARKAIFQESFEIARRETRTLGERNTRELVDGEHYLLDCEFLRNSPGIVSAFIFDAQGNALCPIGGKLLEDKLTEKALFASEPINNCWSRVFYQDKQNCDLAYPIKEIKKNSSQYELVGLARIRYEPNHAFLSMKKLQSLKWKTLFFILLIFAGFWWLMQLWIKKSVSGLTEGVHLAVTGTLQSVDKPESFAAFGPIIDEINKLISRSNQEVSPSLGGADAEARFLQDLIQQVLLLEERAVLAVDKENHLIAASNSLLEVIPVNIERMNAHITEAVEDTHLQGELMTLLNDLSVSDEVIDRPLSMADRVLQVRALPLFLKDGYIASLIFF
jgi:pSer/pThr/pTyr-binding forkhead associated (FHA) protein